MSRANALKEAPALVTLTQYSDGSFSGVASIRKSRRPLAEGEALSHESAWSHLEDVERSARNRRRAARQASVDLRRKVRSADLRRLLTFTNGAEGDGWQTLGECVRDVYEWYASVGYLLLGCSPMALVAERGKGRRRRIHGHMAIRKGQFIPYKEIIESWTAFLVSKGHQPHNSDFHRFHAGDENGDHKNGFSSARVCADYMAKYLAKGFEEDDRGLYQKRYRCNGVMVAEPRRLVGFTLAEVPQLLADTFAGTVEVRWYESPDGDYAGWYIEVGAPSG